MENSCLMSLRSVSGQASLGFITQSPSESEHFPALVENLKGKPQALAVKGEKHPTYSPESNPRLQQLGLEPWSLQ